MRKRRQTAARAAVVCKNIEARLVQKCGQKRSNGSRVSADVALRKRRKETGEQIATSEAFKSRQAKKKARGRIYSDQTIRRQEPDHYPKARVREKTVVRLRGLTREKNPSEGKGERGRSETRWEHQRDGRRGGETTKPSWKRRV